MNKHLANIQPGTRLILALIVLGLEFLLIRLNLSTFIPTVLIVIVASIFLEYKVVHKFLYSAKNKAGRLKQRTLGVRISKYISAAGMVILTLAHLESTPEQVAEFQLLGHLFYCAGTILWIAYLMGYNRMNSWLDEVSSSNT